MYYAFDREAKRICICEAEPEVQYYCPLCDQEVIQRRGEINSHHFAHRKNRDEPCDSWSYDMSEWHRGWQDRFPEDCREIVIIKNGIKHRADVLINGIVIEFQHSRMSFDEFSERNYFYTDAGYRVVWLFDMEEEYTSERILPWKHEWNYKWKYHWHTFDEFDPGNNSLVSVYFQFVNSADDESYGIEQLTWIAPDNGKYFATKEGVAQSCNEFVKMLTCPELTNEQVDSVHTIMRGDAIMDIIEASEEVGKPIPIILRESNAAVVGVHSLKSGVRAKIANMARYQTFDCKKIWGRLGALGGLGYYDDRREVYYWWRSEWVLDWEFGERSQVYQ